MSELATLRRERWPLRVDPTYLCALALEGDCERLSRLQPDACSVRSIGRAYPSLLHPESLLDTLRRPAAQTASEAARDLAAALGSDEGLEQLCASWRGAFRTHATRVGYRFDLYADYLASAREFIVTGLHALPAALPADAGGGDAQAFADAYSDSLRRGAMLFANRQLYRLTRQMVREGVLIRHDEQGRVHELPGLRVQEDPAPLVTERTFRQELKAFVARYGPDLLGRRIWERFRLHHLEGWSQAAIAEHHNVTQQAVSESLAQAAVRLRHAFLEHRRESGAEAARSQG